ncbi:MAG: HAD family hydrolase [Solirubrobacteraceae bacterium]
MQGFSDSAVLFDLDGVLVDSRVAISRCIAHALDAQGFPQPSLESLERFIGPQLTLAFAELTGHPEDSPVVLACLASYRARYRVASLRETLVFSGVPAALETLAASYRLAVATSKPLAFADPLLTALGLSPNPPMGWLSRVDRAQGLRGGGVGVGSEVCRAVSRVF